MRSGEPEAVVRALGLRTVLPANWAAGTAAAEGVFVTPAVDGWVLAVGPDLRCGGDYDAVPGLVAALAAEFGAAAWFLTHEAAEHHGWALAVGGEVVRAFAWAGDDGPVLWQGEATADERALGCFVDDPRDRSDDEHKWWPDRGHVLALAARWSLDPERLAARAPAPSSGVLGRR